MQNRRTPIEFEELFRGMRDKSPKTDEKSPFVRRLVNFDSDANSAFPRKGLRRVFSLTKPIIHIRMVPVFTGMDVYLFTNDEVFKAFTADGQTFTTPVSIGTYAFSTFITSVYWKRETSVLLSGPIVLSKEQYVETTPNSLTREQWTGKILKLTRPNGVVERVLISINTEDVIEVDGYIEVSYTGGTFEILDHEDSLYFTAGGNLYRLGGGNSFVEDTGHDYDVCAIHAGRLFCSKDRDHKVVFTNTQALFFPRQQETYLDPGDGKVMNMTNYFESLVIMMEKGVYTISGQLPEEMIPEKRLSESVSIIGRYSFAVQNGVMYLLTNRGFESFNRLDTQAQPESRPLSYGLADERFNPFVLRPLNPVMAILSNKVLTTMPDYILVHDTDLSVVMGEPWFSEYTGFSFTCADWENSVTLIGSGNNIYLFADKLEDDDFSVFTCSVEGNILEYGPRDGRKIFHDIITYQTWDKQLLPPSGSNEEPWMSVTCAGRNIPAETQTREWHQLVDEERWEITMESPYLHWKIEMRGRFTIEDILFSLSPNKLMHRSHITN